jgi:[acyl-carrier-protein] S-malonyltransferase
MKPAADFMRDKINDIKFNKPSVDIISNVTARVEKDPDKIKTLLIDQIFSTVKWRESLINMSNTGIKNFIEVGPGKALTGMVKRTIKNANCFSINSIADIKKFNDEFKK